MNLFETLPLSERLQRNIAQLSFTEMTPVQARAIPVALDSRDLIVMAPTGTGKTAAFVIPIVEMLTQDERSMALIITPTRELAQQITDVVYGLTYGFKKLRYATLIGGTSVGRDIRTLRGNPRLIIATPGRLNDMIARGAVRLNRTRALVIDEADRMFDMGFAPQVMEIVSALPEECPRQTLLFSATFPAAIEKIFRPLLNNPEEIIVGPRRASVAKNIGQEVIFVRPDKKVSSIVDRLATSEGQTLVFTKTKQGAGDLARTLRAEGFSASEIHGDLSQSVRQRALNEFRTGRSKVLVATDVAARGIDVPKVAQVINFDLPMNSNDYIHRVGRTGRAGEKGIALSLVLLSEKKNWFYLQRRIQNGEEQRRPLPSHSRKKI